MTIDAHCDAVVDAMERIMSSRGDSGWSKGKKVIREHAKALAAFLRHAGAKFATAEAEELVITLNFCESTADLERCGADMAVERIRSIAHREVD